MSVVRCKMQLHRTETFVGYQPVYESGVYKGGTPVRHYKLVFGVVTDGSDENKAFFASTPSGTLSFETVNEAAAKAFRHGQHYYLDLTPAPMPDGSMPTLPVVPEP